MCFTITTPEKIAKKDIVCWKFFERGKTVLRSFYYNSIYRIGETYTTKRFTHCPYTDAIEKGRHSYSSLRLAELSANRFSNMNTVMVKCVIPKSTKYYYNGKDQEYVSLAIKLIKEI